MIACAGKLKCGIGGAGVEKNKTLHIFICFIMRNQLFCKTKLQGWLIILAVIKFTAIA